jgi:putative Mg2+ transporter-C (MgtC) family protein
MSCGTSAEPMNPVAPVRKIRMGMSSMLERASFVPWSCVIDERPGLIGMRQRAARAGQVAAARGGSMQIFDAPGEGLKQFAELGSAFLLSAAIGLEREIRHKSAGLRTYTVVGMSAALFVLISKYGFTDVLESGRVVLDPSRVAAQIVTGIGFIGAGLIFVRGDIVRGLTTAATVWLVTGIGMACGAGLQLLALGVTVAYFIIALAFPLLLRLLPGTPVPVEQAADAQHD